LDALVVTDQPVDKPKKYALPSLPPILFSLRILTLEVIK
jgi:hypothetical protein